MKSCELAKYRIMLKERLARLKAPSSKRGEIVIQRAPDLLDEVQLLAERELALSNLTWESALARRIAAALARMEERAYGICLECGEEIKPRRLAAVPWAEFCVACQEAVEQGEPERRNKPLVESADEADTYQARSRAA